MPWTVDLLPADAALCARDADLPGLGAVLNASPLARTIGLGELRHSYLNYKPGTNCVAGLVPVDGSLDAWVAMTYPQARWPEIRKRPKWNEGPRTAVYFDDAFTVFVPLALERRLPKARQLSDDASRAALLSRLGLSNHRLRILRYKPGRRIVLCADGPHGPVAVIKMHADQAAYDRAVAGAVYARSMGGPEVIGTAQDDFAIATAWTRGHALSPQSAPRDFNLAGAMLAHHHVAGNPKKLPDWKPPALLRTVEAISALSPALEVQAQRLAQRLPELTASEMVALHGDFSADQVIRDGQGTVILDWDRAATGPAARDLGSALARLDLDEIEGVDTNEARTALLEGYGAVRELPSGRTIAAHRAQALFALAAEAFRARRADWDDQLRAVLRRVEELCQNPPMPTTKGTIPGLAKALKPEHMRAGFGEKPKAITLTRLKPGRRAMLEYVLPDGQVLLGKLRAKGADRNAPHLQSKLRSAGLNGRDGVGVAPVAGTMDDPAIWLQEQVPGDALGDMQDGSALAHLDAMRRTGRALAKLHSTPAQTTRQWTHADEWDVLEKALSNGPHDDLLSLARARLDGLPSAPRVGLHRDFYFDQVLVTPDTIWLVDLDLYALGDAAIDLGNFLAHLDELALRRGREPGYFAAQQDAFLEGYANLAPLPDMHRVNSFRWISLARHIAIAARFPDRRHAIPALEALCRKELSKGQ
ncbi:phosphotransferase [Tateyamaria omphalii]|uniref:phosphotransferase n=1 Tax=Tateyamaria omphalii TaxID=299262 RepID=UPI001C9A03D0|nr:phosphotransferase [Tateyamaria omphalii]MBY5935113.1 phosphotransferase [Tateyamaria omphalii]